MDHAGGEPGPEARPTTAPLAQRVESAERALLRQNDTGGPVIRVIARVMKEQSAEGVGLAASGAAFWLVIAAFPAGIAAVSIFGLLVSPERVAADLSRITSAEPASLGTILSTQLQHVAADDRVGLSAGLAASIIAALWSVSAAVYNLERAIRTAYGLGTGRYVVARGRAFLGGVVAVLGLGVIALASTAASVALAYVPGVLTAIAGVPTLGLVIASTAAGLYRFSIGHSVGLRRLLPGAVMSAIGLVLLAGGFGVYLKVSTRYTAVYGALAGAVIGMIAAYLAVYVLLIGAVLNAQLDASAGEVEP